MARSVLQILEILEHCAQSEFTVHIVKQNMVFKEALAKRKAEGMVLGRPKGKAKRVKLDKHSKDIRRYLELGISKRAICKLVDCSPSTLYDWIERRKVEV